MVKDGREIEQRMEVGFKKKRLEPDVIFLYIP